MSLAIAATLLAACGGGPRTHVRYVDNGRTLDSPALPVPAPVEPSG